MKVFLVGGAVRDELLDREVKDRDYVVVGSTPEEMINNGFENVGADFPVFLHPKTGEEYALARRERKTGHGYHGFESDHTATVTLEDDLFRRDLTINAIAKDVETGEYIDPFNGIDDIQKKIFRPVSEHFKEDPVRILRVHRFAARFGDDWMFDVRLRHYFEEMRNNDEFKHLTRERVLLEIEKAMGEPHFYLFWNESEVGEILTIMMDRYFEPNHNIPAQIRDNRVSNMFALSENVVHQELFKFLGASNDFMREWLFNRFIHSILEYGDWSPFSEKWLRLSKVLNNKGELFLKHLKVLKDNLDKDQDREALDLIDRLIPAMVAQSKLRFQDFDDGRDPKEVGERLMMARSDHLVMAANRQKGHRNASRIS